MYIKSSQKNETLKHTAVLSLSSKTLETINKFSYCCLRNAQVCRGMTAGTFAQTRKKELVMQLLLLLFVCTKDTCTFFCVYKHFRPSLTSLHKFLPPRMNLCLACLSVTDCNHAVPKLHFTFLFEHTPMLHLQTLNLSTFFANYKFVICNSCYMILTEIKSIQLNFSLQLLF